MLYEVWDIQTMGLMDSKTIEAERPIDAGYAHLKEIRELNKKLKISASNDVRIKVTPCVRKDGRIFRLAGRSYRQVWFEVLDDPIKQEAMF